MDNLACHIYLIRTQKGGGEMGEWVDTPYGRRYKEDHGTCTAFFLTEPDKNGKRPLPANALKIILEAKLRKQSKEEKEKKSRECTLKI